MTGQPIPAVLYAAKSTEDTHGSLPTQRADCRALAADRGFEVVAEFADEAFSAYHGDRGPGLAAAKAECERLSTEHGRCALIVQHSDRLARGDGKSAQHLVEVALWALKHDVTICSVQDPQTFGDLLYTVVTGQRNHEDSARKSRSVRDGFERRKQRGLACGSVRFGYMLEPQMRDGKPVVERGFVVNDRVPDPVTAPIADEMFAMAESGATPGEVGRTWNARGVRTTRGYGWNRGNVASLLRSPAYKGEDGYPAIVSPERWQAVQDQLDRADAAAVQRRKGGRPAATDFPLRGMLFCGVCGAAMNIRADRPGRRYQCRNSRRATGLCNARPVPADVLERHVLNHLDTFIGSVEGWLCEKAAERTVAQREGEAAIDRERQSLAKLGRTSDKLRAEWRRMVDDGDPLARIALEEVERIDRERDAQAQAIAQAEAVVAEWVGASDMDAALDYYNAIVDVIHGRVRQADGAEALNRALASVLAGLWVEVESVDEVVPGPNASVAGGVLRRIEPRPVRVRCERLLVEFALHDRPADRLPGGVDVLPEFRRERDCLPPASLGYLPLEPRPFEAVQLAGQLRSTRRRS
jgi:site-specific DNA recombinase